MGFLGMEHCSAAGGGSGLGVIVDNRRRFCFRDQACFRRTARNGPARFCTSFHGSRLGVFIPIGRTARLDGYTVFPAPENNIALRDGSGLRRSEDKPRRRRAYDNSGVCHAADHNPVWMRPGPQRIR